MFQITVIIVLAAVVMLVLALFWRFQHGAGTEHVRHFAFPHSWLDPLEQEVPFYRTLPMDLREAFQDKIINLIDGKRWRPGDGMGELTDDMKVIIAGNAAAVVFRRDRTDDFRAILTVQIHPADSIPATAEGRLAILEGEGASSTVFMLWDEKTRTARSLRDLDSASLATAAAALAEPGVAGQQGGEGRVFAHTPWARAAALAFLTPLPGAEDVSSVLTPLGVDEPAEAFAAATEVFLTNPRHLAQRHPELYARLLAFYQIDPARWRQKA